MSNVPKCILLGNTIVKNSKRRNHKFLVVLLSFLSDPSLRVSHLFGCKYLLEATTYQSRLTRQHCITSSFERYPKIFVVTSTGNEEVGFAFRVTPPCCTSSFEDRSAYML